MYNIGRIFNIIGLAFCAIMTIVMLICMIAGVDGAAATFVTFITYTVIYIVTYILATKARRSIDNGVVDKTPHIIMIVVGAVSQDVFYLLGGIFGLIAESQEGKE